MSRRHALHRSCRHRSAGIGTGQSPAELLAGLSPGATAAKAKAEDSHDDHTDGGEAIVDISDDASAAGGGSQARATIEAGTGAPSATSAAVAPEAVPERVDMRPYRSVSVAEAAAEKAAAEEAAAAKAAAEKAAAEEAAAAKAAAEKAAAEKAAAAKAAAEKAASEKAAAEPAAEPAAAPEAEPEAEPDAEKAATDQAGGSAQAPSPAEREQPACARAQSPAGSFDNMGDDDMQLGEEEEEEEEEEEGVSPDHATGGARLGAGVLEAAEDGTVANQAKKISISEELTAAQVLTAPEPSASPLFADRIKPRIFRSQRCSPPRRCSPSRSHSRPLSLPTSNP